MFLKGLLERMINAGRQLWESYICPKCEKRAENENSHYADRPSKIKNK
jgi:hypothetical protein